MITVIAGVSMFSAVVLSLVGLLLVARSRLVTSRQVRIVVNDDEDRALTAASGGTLLDTLAAADIFIPSACGGQGTCGVCKAEVREGGGALLPTERGLVSRAEARRGVRLTCQVRVRTDMRIAVPDEVFSATRWTCTVRSNRNVATFIKELVLDLPEGEHVPFRAGGYVQLECPPHALRYADLDVAPEFRDAWDAADLWRLVSRVDAPASRAYSMANCPDERGIIMLNIRIAPPPPGAPATVPPGQLSSWAFALQPGDAVQVAGPFGEFYARETEAEMCFLGGGAGMAPMRSHILDQLTRLHSKRTITFWYGARSLREAFYVEEFDALQREHDNFTWHLALSEPAPGDHWSGHTGYIHAVARDAYLARHPAPEDVEYYVCGPPAMLDACRGMLDELGVEPGNVLFDDFGI